MLLVEVLGFGCWSRVLARTRALNHAICVYAALHCAELLHLEAIKVRLVRNISLLHSFLSSKFNCFCRFSPNLALVSAHSSDVVLSFLFSHGLVLAIKNTLNRSAWAISFAINRSGRELDRHRLFVSNDLLLHQIRVFLTEGRDILTDNLLLNTQFVHLGKIALFSNKFILWVLIPRRHKSTCTKSIRLTLFAVNMALSWQIHSGLLDLTNFAFKQQLIFLRFHS